MLFCKVYRRSFLKEILLVDGNTAFLLFRFIKGGVCVFQQFVEGQIRAAARYSKTGRYG